MKIGPVDRKKILIGGPKSRVVVVVVVVRILYASKEPSAIYIWYSKTQHERSWFSVGELFGFEDTT
jgi:hypothetical protein